MSIAQIFAEWYGRILDDTATLSEYREVQSKERAARRARKINDRLPHADTPILDLLNRQIERIDRASLFTLRREADGLIDIIAALAREYERRIGEIREELRGLSSDYPPTEAN